ncbi:MAG: hypothetical protein IIB32_04590 [Chloroflexi bacterium]|nr:hypothetical protein [Chloroflexota bacterium]
MPQPVVYLLFALGAVLVMGGFAKPRRFDSALKMIDLRIGDRLRLGLNQYRRAGLIIGALIIGLGWYGGNAPSLPDSTEPPDATQSPTVLESGGHLIFESDFIKIELPGDWTATDAFGFDILDLDTSKLPRAVQISISAIPIGIEELHLFAFDKDYRATLVILASDIEGVSVSLQLDRRESLYTWIGVPVAETQAGLIINGIDAGILVLDPIHRYELFREKQYLVTTEKQTFFLIFSTLADFYQEREPMFEDIASSFRVLVES